MIQYVVRASQANVLCPACKLWNTGHGANMMREAVSLNAGRALLEVSGGVGIDQLRWIAATGVPVPMKPPWAGSRVGRILTARACPTLTGRVLKPCRR